MSFNQRFGRGGGMFGGMGRGMGGMGAGMGMGGSMSGGMGGNMRGNMGGGGMQSLMGRYMGPSAYIGGSGLLPTPGGRGGGGAGNMMMGRGGMGGGGQGYNARPRGPRPPLPSAPSISSGGSNSGGGNSGPGNKSKTSSPAPEIQKKDQAEETPTKKPDIKPDEKKDKEKENTPAKTSKEDEKKPATPSSQAAKPPAPLATSTPTSQSSTPTTKPGPEPLLSIEKTPDQSSAASVPPWKRHHDGNSTLDKSRDSAKDDSQNNSMKGNSSSGSGGKNSFTGRPGRNPELDVDEPPNSDPAAVCLDFYNSDLHFRIGPSGYTAEAITEPSGFCFCWAGGRGTYGVTQGKVCYEVMLTEYLPVDYGDDHQEEHPHVIRVGWSLDSTSFQLGEEPMSYGYGGTGRFSTNNKFSVYGEEFGQGDVILTMVDLETRPPNISYAKNGRWLGVAVPLPRWPVGVKEKALFPHILTKNCRFEVNFGQRQPWYPAPPSFTFIGHVPLNLRVRGLLPPAKKADCEMIMMCGLPGTGKTTWASKYCKDHPEKRYNVLGTDSLIDKMKVMGLPRKRNFSGRWDVLIQKATASLNKLFQIASRRKRNLILDQTNVYPTARVRKMRNFQGFQRKVAVLVPTDEEMKRRAEKRTREEGKEVPESAVLEMKANFKLPEDTDPELDTIVWVEQGREAAQMLVEQYNKEGQKKVHPSKIVQRRDNRFGNRDTRGPRDNRGRTDFRDNRDRRDDRDRSLSQDRGSSHDRERDLRSQESGDSQGSAMSGMGRGRGRGSSDRGRGGFGGSDRGRGGDRGLGSHGDRSKELFSQAEGSHDSDRKSGGGYGAGRGSWRGDHNRGERGRPGGHGGSRGTSWGEGQDYESAPWSQQSQQHDMDVESTFSSGGGRGRGGRGSGRGGRGGQQASSDFPPWQRGQYDTEQPRNEPPSLLGQPPEKKMKQESGSGLDFIKKEYEESGTKARMDPPSLMGEGWRSGPVKVEPQDQPVYDQDQRYGSVQGQYGSSDPPLGVGGGGPYGYGQRAREPSDTMRGSMGRPPPQPPAHTDYPVREWDTDGKEQDMWGHYEQEDAIKTEPKDAGGPRGYHGQRDQRDAPSDISGHDRSYRRPDPDRPFGGRDDKYPGQERKYGGEGNQYGGQDTYGGRLGADRGGYHRSGPESNRDRYGRPSDEKGGDFRPDSHPADSHLGMGRPDDMQSTDNRQGNGRQRESRYGGDQRGGYGRPSEGGNHYNRDHSNLGQYNRGPPEQFRQDSSYDRNAPTRNDPYERQNIGDYDRGRGQDREQEPYGKPSYQRESHDKSNMPPIDRDREYSAGAQDSRWGGQKQGNMDWRNQGGQWPKRDNDLRYPDRSRGQGPGRWGAAKHDDDIRDTRAPPPAQPPRTSRWGQEPVGDSYQQEPDVGEPPSTSWTGDEDSGAVPLKDAMPSGDRGYDESANQQYYGYNRFPREEQQKKDTYEGGMRDSDSRPGAYSWKGRWSEPEPTDSGRRQPASDPSSYNQPPSRWESSRHWGNQADQGYGSDNRSTGYGAVPGRDAPSRSDAPPGSSWSSTEAVKGQSWASKPPPPPPPPVEKPPEKPVEQNPYAGWSQHGYYGGYEDTSATKTSSTPAASEAKSDPQAEWANYWQQQDIQSSTSNQPSTDSWSASKGNTGTAGTSQSTESRSEPPPPQQTWAWGPQGWQLTSSSTSTSNTMSSSAGGLYQPPPPPPPEDDSLKKKKSRWGGEEQEESQAMSGYSQSTMGSQSVGYSDAGYGQGQQWSDVYQYGQSKASTMLSSSQQVATEQQSLEKVANQSASAMLSQSGTKEAYSTRSSYASSATTALTSQQNPAKPVSGGAGLMGTSPAESGTAQQSETASLVAGVDHSKLVGSPAISQMHGAGLAAAAMAGRGVPTQALVGAPMMTPGLSAAMATPGMAPGFIGLYQPAAFTRGAPALGAFPGRMPYQPR